MSDKKAYTYEELVKMGATPSNEQGKAYSYDELVTMGATPSPTKEARKSAPGRLLTGAASEVFGAENTPLPPEIENDPIYRLPSSQPERFIHSLVSPTIKNIAGQAQAGNIAGAAGAAAGELATLGGAGLLDKLIQRIKLGPVVKTVTNPVERRALDWAERQGIRQTVGQKTGQQGLQSVEANLENLPGSATRAREFYQGQAGDVARVGSELAARPSQITTSAYDAGKEIERNLIKQINADKTMADLAYNSVRKDLAKNQVKTKIGERPSKVLLPSGEPAMEPVFKVFETPVALDPIRSELAPIFDDLQRTLPEARRAASPAFRALQDLMTSKEQFMAAMDFDRFLSAVKALTRDGTSEFLTSRSQGIARQIIANGEAEFQKAVKGVDPSILQRLKVGRESVRKYHETAEFMQDLGEPGAIYDRIIRGGNYTIDTLAELKKRSPKDVDVMARTFLEGMIDKATAEGGFSRSAGIMRDWQKLPPETKELLFGTKLSRDMENFLIAAKRLEHPAGSRTEPMRSAMFSYGAPLAAIGEIITGTAMGHPGVGLAGASATMGYAYLRPAILVRLLMTPGGAEKLTQVMSAPSHGVKTVLAAQGLQRMLTGIEQDEAIAK